MLQNRAVELVKKRAQLLRQLRSFFYARNFTEGDVPVLGESTVTDVNIESLCVEVNGKEKFLQTSPEFFLKRLLCEGLGSCFYLGKAFRAEEEGPLHKSEFTMCEWYWLDETYHELMDQLIELVSELNQSFSNCSLSFAKTTYKNAFKDVTNLDPHTASVQELKAYARENLNAAFDANDKNTWLDCVFSFAVQPQLNNLTVIYDFPSSQAALAKTYVNEENVKVAQRFELFWKGVELANGYQELTDVAEQKKRFDADVNQRRNEGKKFVQPDENFLKALEKGLPECSGVAMGVDRLLMCLLGEDSIPR